MPPTPAREGPCQAGSFFPSRKKIRSLLFQNPVIFFASLHPLSPPPPFEQTDALRSPYLGPPFEYYQKYALQASKQARILKRNHDADSNLNGAVPMYVQLQEEHPLFCADRVREGEEGSKILSRAALGVWKAGVGRIFSSSCSKLFSRRLSGGPLLCRCVRWRRRSEREGGKFDFLLARFGLEASFARAFSPVVPTYSLFVFRKAGCHESLDCGSFSVNTWMGKVRSRFQLNSCQTLLSHLRARLLFQEGSSSIVILLFLFF